MVRQPPSKRIVLIGNVEPQTSAAWRVICDSHHLGFHVADPSLVRGLRPDLIVVAGWRRLIPPDILALAPTVGFHSAKLPEYPGRAPVPWALLRSDTETANTMLYLNEGVDSGDIIDSRTIPIPPDATPEWLYGRMASTLVEMLHRHLPALLDGTAPRTPQDTSKRGPLTTPDGWALWLASQS
jgi:methionyl-tRNA formyltransferase